MTSYVTCEAKNFIFHEVHTSFGCENAREGVVHKNTLTWPGEGALQYEMDTGVRLKLPNTRAFSESEEKKSGRIG